MADPKWRKQLDPVMYNAVTYVNNIAKGELLDRLLAQELINGDQYSKLRRSLKNNSSDEFARDLFEDLKTRPAPSFDNFVAVLEEVGGGGDLRDCLLRAHSLTSTPCPAEMDEAVCLAPRDGGNDLKDCSSGTRRSEATVTSRSAEMAHASNLPSQWDAAEVARLQDADEVIDVVKQRLSARCLAIEERWRHLKDRRAFARVWRQLELQVASETEINYCKNTPRDKGDEKITMELSSERKNFSDAMGNAAAQNFPGDERVKEKKQQPPGCFENVLNDRECSIQITSSFVPQRLEGCGIEQSNNKRTPNYAVSVRELKLTGEREVLFVSTIDLANILDFSIDFTCLTALVVDIHAYRKFLTALLGGTCTKWLKPFARYSFWGREPFSEYVEKIFGACYPSVDGFTTTWEVAGKLPFTHCVMLKLLMTASKSRIVVPVNVNSVLSSCLRGLPEKESGESLLNLYDVLTPLRVIASFDEDSAKRLPQVVFLGLHDTNFNGNLKWQSSFIRIVKEAMSKNWPESRLSVLFVPEEKIRKTIEDLPLHILGWTMSEGDCQEEKLKLERRILKCRQKQRFVLGKELGGENESLYLKSYLNQKNFITTPMCSISHKDKPVDPLEVWSLIDGQDIESAFSELIDYSYIARKAFEKHGLIPAEVVKDVLDGWGGHEKWLPVLSHYGIVILPADIQCGHPEFDEVEKVGPRRDYRPASLPEPAQKNYIIPHLLPRKKLPTEDLGSYLRTEAFVIRHEGGHRISEGLFYYLVAILIKHYPQAPWCYHHAARLRVDKSGHILELKLRDDVLCASMLVKTSDKSFTLTGTAELCFEVKQILKRDAKGLSESYLSKGLQFGALMTTHDQMDDFVSLDTESFLSGTSLYSEEGEEFHPPRSLFLWFNCYGPKGSSSLDKNFAKLSEEMDAKQVLDYLIANEEITGEEYKEVVNDKYPALTARRLLMMIGERKKECDTLLYEALWHTGQCALAELIIRGSLELGHIGASAIDTVQRKSPTAKSLLDVPTADPGRQPEESKEQQSLVGGERKTPITHPTPDETADFLLITMISAGGMTAYSPTSTLSVALGRQTNPHSQVLQQQASSVGMSTPAVSKECSHLPSSSSVPLAEPVPVKEDPKVNAVFDAKYFHVEQATDHFNEQPFKGGGKRLGSGSFGTVYHGLLHAENGQKFEVAIKRIKKASSLNPAQIERSRKQFGTELFMLTRYLHKNVVSLIGFSNDGPELCLVYEYMANGSLSHRLDCRDNTPPLQWKIRLPISRDVARGLDFLHSRYRLPVIHRDVKSSNVLLTSDFKAKLSDFGLAIVGGETEETSTGPAVGTRPYMPPEAFQKVLTTKVDVYGLGMIFYELATGLPPYSTKKKQDLKSYVDDIEQQGIDLTKMLDPKAKWPKAREGSWGVNLLEVAKQCTVKDYTKRVEVAKILPKLDDLIRTSGALN